MRLKDFKIIYLLVLSNLLSFGQSEVSGTVFDKFTEAPIASVEIFSGFGKLLTTTDIEGAYAFVTDKDSLDLIYFSYNYKPFKTTINTSKNLDLMVDLEPFTEQLSSVELAVVKKQYFSVKRMADVEEMAIYAGKKNEVVVMNNIFANLSSSSLLAQSCQKSHSLPLASKGLKIISPRSGL